MRAEPRRGMLVEVSIRYLIVDDNLRFLAAARASLERQGEEVAGIATTTNEALRQTESLRPTSCWSTSSLGEESGFELARSSSSSVPRRRRVILISTHAEDDFADLVAASPAVGFLPKSDSRRHLRERLDAARLARLQERDHGEHAPVVVLRLGQPSFIRMLRTCFSTVPSVTHSRRAMPAFERPSAISASTSRSRGVSTSSGSSTRRGGDQLLDERRDRRPSRPRRSARASRGTRPRR